MYQGNRISAKLSEEVVLTGGTLKNKESEIAQTIGLHHTFWLLLVYVAQELPFIKQLIYL